MRQKIQIVLGLLGIYGPEVEAGKIQRSPWGCVNPKIWYRLKENDESQQALDFLCSTEATNQALFRNGTECIVTCENNLKPTDAVVVCSCYRSTGRERNNCRWMPRRRYAPMKCVNNQGTRDTFSLQMSILTGMPPPDYVEDYVEGGDLEQSQIREIGELAFEVFDEPTFVFNSEPGSAPFTMEMPSIDLSSLGSEEHNAELMVGDLSAKKSDMLLSDDIVYTRTQAKKLRKQGFIIPSYRVLAGKSERMNMAARMGHGSALAHGDRAVVAVNSEMMQQRWTKWKDGNGTYIVPYYFSKSFPGTEENIHTINSHINWFNKELNQCIKLEEVNNFDFRYDSKIRIIDGNGCWSYIGMTGEDTQDLSLGSFCYTKGLSLHEFIHALGFDHEQNRPDRDQYVIMHWEKIRDDKKWNFQIMTNGEWKSTGHEYDFQSVMHYSSKNFAKDGVGPTMTRRVNGRDTGEEIVAQRDRPSTVDMQQICAIYNCEENCGHKMKTCASGDQEIFEHRFCDGIIDCADESDEQGCSWGCCEEFEIDINGRDYSYVRLGQYKGKDYFFSAKDNKYLFFYHGYWGFSEVLGQPTFYYYAKADTQCPDNVNFLYYSWKVQGSAHSKPRCTKSSAPSAKEAVETTTTTTITTSTTKVATTTTTPQAICEATDLNPVEGGTWKCGGSVCQAKCNVPGYVPDCTEASKITCLLGHGWNFKTTKCTCKMPEQKCGALNVLKLSSAKKGADYSCTNGNTVGSECSITCPLKNQQAYCKSSKGKRNFTCEKNGWSSNSKNDCECKTACSSPEEQFPHIGKDILPSFDSCSSVFKNAKCKAKCPVNTYARNKNNAGSSILTKCSCQGQNCLWAVGKTIKPDLFCIKRNYCEHPVHFFAKLHSSATDKIVCDADATDNGLFIPGGSSCSFGCSVTKKVQGGMTCNCDEKGFCSWIDTSTMSKPRLKSLSANTPIKCS